MHVLHKMRQCDYSYCPVPFDQMETSRSMQTRSGNPVRTPNRNGIFPTSELSQGFWIYLYFRIRHSFAHLRPVILPADWSISRLQSWTCSSLPTVAEFVKLTQSIVIEIQRQSADLYKVQLCNQQFFVVSTAVYVVKVYECHPLDWVLRGFFWMS